MSDLRIQLLFFSLFFSRFSYAMDQQLATMSADSKKFTFSTQLLPTLQDRRLDTIKEETRTLLGAVYFKEYKAVENILNNSSRRSHCYYFNSHHYGALSAHIIARHNKDKQMVDLLNKYKYEEFYSLEDMPTDLMIGCYTRNIDYIKKIIDICPPHLHNRNSIEDCLTLTVERRDVECINLLLSCKVIRDTIDYYYFINLLCKTLRHDEMDKVVEALLAGGCYRLFHNPFTHKSPYDAIIEKYIVQKEKQKSI